MKTCKTCWSRRDFLFRSGGGVSGLALAYLLLLSAGILLVIRVVGGLAPTGVPRALPALVATGYPVLVGISFHRGFCASKSR